MPYNLYHQEPYGRAEAIKLLLWYAKAEYTVHAHSVADLQGLVAAGTIKSEFGDFPVLEHDGKFYAKGPAIIRYLARRHGLYPEDANEAYRVDSTLESVRDLIYKLVPIALETDEEAKKEKGKDALTNFLPAWLAAHEERVAANGHENFLVGDKLTAADIQFLGVVRVLFKNEKVPFHEQLQGVFSQFPKLNALVDNLSKHFEGYQ
jgi:glutathione S-transferase